MVARYDLAQFVARAMANENRATAEDKVILNKLQQEYSNELKIMMVMPAEPAPVKEEPQATNNFFDNGKLSGLVMHVFVIKQIIKLIPQRVIQLM